MARLSFSTISVFLLLVAMAFGIIEFATANAGGAGSLFPDQCDGACDYRCSATSHTKPCLFFCNKCCQTCLCVPSGTDGHKDECPCYRDWKSQEVGPKCP